MIFLDLMFTGDTHSVKSALTLLQKKFEFEFNESGYEIILHQSSQLNLTMSDERTIIHYQEKNDFCRLFSLFFLSYQKNQNVTISEQKQFERLGVMIDCSRNAVPKLETLFSLLIELASLGYNYLMLYTEDTYQIPNEPYFGYFRGAYSFDELKNLDNYAEKLGLEIIPCIQTLAHLTNVLQWYPYYEVRDTEDILLVDHPNTYLLIEKMIEAASSPFRSKRIHIGMDEAHYLGLGRYLQKNGYHDRFTVMQNHLNKVMDILDKKKLEPMMWSDMYFRMGSSTGDYYDLEAEIPEEIITQIPKIDMVYWDYYHSEETDYDILLQKHQTLNKTPIFAGGIWTFNGIAPNYGKTFVTTNSALTACKKQKVKEVLATVWLDDGAETPLKTIMPGLILFAEHMYCHNISQTSFTDKLTLYTGLTYDSWMLLQQFDETIGVDKYNLSASSPSKCLLWQDPLLGLYDANFTEIDLEKHYSLLFNELSKLDCSQEYSALFYFYQQLSFVLMKKAQLSQQLLKAYRQNDDSSLHEMVELLTLLQEQCEELKQRHYYLWDATNKPHGWEIIDIRYGGLIARLKTTQQKVQAYLNDQIAIPELEDERLTTVSSVQLEKGNLGRQLYRHIVSASKLSDV